MIRKMLTEIWDTVIEKRDALWETTTQTCDTVWEKIALKKSLALAKKYGENATQETIDFVQEKLPLMNRGKVAEIWETVTKMWNMFLGADTPLYKKAAIIGALVYLVSPFDIIPDMVPIFGLGDDVSVLLFTASRVLATISAAKVVSTAVIERAKIEIQKQLHVEYKTTLTSTIIISGITLIGILSLGFKPISENIALWISSLLLQGVFIYSAIRVALFIPKIAVPIYHIITQKSLAAGLAEYLKRRFSELEIYDTIVEFTNQRLASFIKIPQVKVVINAVIPYFIKRVAIFVAMLLSYTIVVHLILKPRLIEEMSGLGIFQFYGYPFIESFKFLFGG